MFRNPNQMCNENFTPQHASHGQNEILTNLSHNYVLTLAVGQVGAIHMRIKVETIRWMVLTWMKLQKRI